MGCDALLPKSLAHPWALLSCPKELQELDPSPKPPPAPFSHVLTGASHQGPHGSWWLLPPCRTPELGWGLQVGDGSYQKWDEIKKEPKVAV